MIRIDMKPLSMGRIWSTNRQGRRFLTKEGKDFKKAVGMIVASKFKEFKGYKKEKGLYIKFYGDWYTKKGTISKTAGDLDNFNKLIIDGISEALDFNDSEFFSLNTYKSMVRSEVAYFELNLFAYTEANC